MAPPPKDVRYRPGVWTGRELIVWGAEKEGADPVGAAYDPARDTWRSIADAPGGAKPFRAPAVWTGIEVVYWPNAAYDPAKDSWRTISEPPIERLSPELAWVGGEVIVWGGMTRCCAIDSTVHDDKAVAYDPVDDTWRALPDVPDHVAGDGSEAISVEHNGSMYVFRDRRLARFDPSSEKWADLGGPTPPSEEGCWVTGGPIHEATFVGDRFFTWSGSCYAINGEVYSEAGTWKDIADAADGLSALAPTDAAIYATATASSDDRLSIVRYSIAHDSWSTIDNPPVKLGFSPQLVWTGSALLIWGGFGDNSPAGALYTP
jgi:hypothetical protein